MFTGIIETLGKVVHIEKNNTNIDYTIQSNITSELKIDQSVSHNGVCLTVVSIEKSNYIVTAIDQTLQTSNLKTLKTGDTVNLERAMKLGDRLDGHIVQGHVDTTAICKAIDEKNGSWIFTFSFNSDQNTTVEKGSITINGTSLTVINSKKSEFSVAIIPYTFENTIFKSLKINDTVNLEFDMIGKYVSKLIGAYKN